MIGKLLAGGAEGIGNAVSDVVGTIWGSRGEQDQAVHDEMMAVYQQFAAEFAGRPPATWWDSFVDGLNRLPRPVITISAFFGPPAWAYWDPVGFAEFVEAMGLLPEYYWAGNLMILAFWFGGRFIARDLAKAPKLSREQAQLAADLAARRAARAQQQENQVAAATVLPSPQVDEEKGSLPVKREPPQAGVDAMIADLIEREGGYVDHPADRGGATKYGITRATLASWVGADVSKADVRALTKEEAARIYRAVYYLGPGIDTLPEGIQEHVFDIAVNSGPRTAIKLLQRALTRLGAKLTIDGVIGPATRAVAAARPANNINRELVDVRLAFYDDIVAGDPRQAAFIKGWRARARGFWPGDTAA